MKIYTFFSGFFCLFLSVSLSALYGQAATTLPYSQNFDTANDFTLVNGSAVNKWFYGSATGNTGNSLYISNNNSANAYTTGSTSIVHAYRDFTIPAGSTIANFSFDWKGQGESTFDYLRVWLVPTAFTPTAGSNIAAGTARVQVGQFNQQSTWQTYSTPSLNISSYAGSTMRLVFEWTNDNFFGTQPPIAVDNINISIPTCIMPSNMAVSTVTTNTATLTWTPPNPVPGVGYEYYLSTTNTPPTSATTGFTNAGTTATPGGLATATTYFWWVRSVCSAIDKSAWVAGPSFSTTQIPATIPYTQDFSTGNDLQLSNGTQANKWFHGAATGNPANSLYISNTNGTTNAYNIGSSSVVYAFRDIIVPAGTTDATLMFDWKGSGESNWDYLRVWMVPVNYVPTVGTQITAGNGRIRIGGNFNQQAGWQNYFNPSLNLSSFAGNVMRLVFEWTNDGFGGTQPPIAIDNINLSIPTCKVPQNIQVTSVGSNTASISWTAPSPAPVGGYQIYVSTANVPPTSSSTPTSSATGTSTTLSPLTPNTTYYFWVRSVCAGSDRSFWVAGPSFTTSQIPATLPYIQQFTNGSDLGYTNGNQVNKWTYGSATGNPANSLYISNTNGATNAYNNGSSSVVHAYRDIAIPAGTTLATFSFDWKSAGENNWDYLRVWLVPTTFMPVSGTQIAAGTGRIQIGANYQLQTTWQTVINPTLDISSFAGSTMRLVFEWRNDGFGGVQPPAAIDNINLRVCSKATPVVTVGTPTHNSVVLTWNQDSGGASYIVRYRPVGSGASWQSVGIAAAPYPTPTNTTTLSNLLSAASYEVQIVAVCNGSEGMPSNNTFTTRCDPTPPSVLISNITTNSALITWSPLAASSHYFMRYRIVGSGNAGWSATIPLPAAPANSYPLGSLNVYTTYEVQIANKCDNETTLNPWSNPKVFTTQRTCDIAPPGLTITNFTTTTAQVTWDPFPGATYILRYRKVGIPSWTTVFSNTNTITLSGLLELGQYELQVANVCGGTPGNYTLPYFFTVPTITYCQMASTGSASEYISKVTVTPNGKPEKINESQASNYTDYTGITARFIEMIQGSSNNRITIDKKLSGGTNAGIAVWIDFNRNGYFDINERVFVSAPNNLEKVSGTFSVPADAFISLTDFKYVVMRVAMQKDGIPVNCTNFPNGEVEDYTVKISKPRVENSIDQTGVLIYPNPVKTVINVKNISKKANYKIYNASGQIVSSGIILNNKIDVHTLINGVYVIDIDDNQVAAQKKFIKE